MSWIFEWIQNEANDIAVCAVSVQASKPDHMDRIRLGVSNDQLQVSAVVLILLVSSLRW